MPSVLDCDLYGFHAVLMKRISRWGLRRVCPGSNSHHLATFRATRPKLQAGEFSGAFSLSLCSIIPKSLQILSNDTRSLSANYVLRRRANNGVYCAITKGNEALKEDKLFHLTLCQCRLLPQTPKGKVSICFNQEKQ